MWKVEHGKSPIGLLKILELRTMQPGMYFSIIPTSFNSFIALLIAAGSSLVSEESCDWLKYKLVVKLPSLELKKCWRICERTFKVLILLIFLMLGHKEFVTRMYLLLFMSILVKFFVRLLYHSGMLFTTRLKNTIDWGVR